MKAPRILLFSSARIRFGPLIMSQASRACCTNVRRKVRRLDIEVNGPSGHQATE